MPGCGWREETDGFRFFEIDFTGGDSRERTIVLQESIDAVQVPDGRVPMLVHWEAGAFDIGWFKQVKDANRMLKHLDLRAAFVGLGARGGAYAGVLNLRVGHERVRHFPDVAAALTWLREDG